LFKTTNLPWNRGASENKTGKWKNELSFIKDGAVQCLVKEIQKDIG